MKDIKSNIDKLANVEQPTPLKESLDKFVNMFKDDHGDNKTENISNNTNEKFDSKSFFKSLLGDDTVPDDANADKEEKTLENEKKEPIQNKKDGLAREQKVKDELNEKFPLEKGYTILEEVYLKDKDGKIAKDPETGEARRIDFAVIKDGKVIETIEVTSQTSDKTSQTAKEERIRENGGNYIQDKDGNLIEIPSNVTTKIERRD